MENVDKLAEDAIEMATKKVSRRQIASNVYRALVDMHKELKEHFGDKEPTMKNLVKFWGTCFEKELIAWTVHIGVLCKMGFQMEGTTLGFVTQEVDPELVKFKEPFHTCVVCAATGWFKKCPCGKDRYCSEWCQKTDWKRHKAEYH